MLLLGSCVSSFHTHEDQQNLPSEKYPLVYLKLEDTYPHLTPRKTNLIKQICLWNTICTLDAWEKSTTYRLRAGAASKFCFGPLRLRLLISSTNTKGVPQLDFYLLTTHQIQAYQRKNHHNTVCWRAWSKVEIHFLKPSVAKLATGKDTGYKLRGLIVKVNNHQLCQSQEWHCLHQPHPVLEGGKWHKQ